MMMIMVTGGQWHRITDVNHKTGISLSLNLKRFNLRLIRSPLFKSLLVNVRSLSIVHLNDRL